MKRRAERPPVGKQRPAVRSDDQRPRVRDKSSLPGSPRRSEETLPADRGAREQESTSQGSE
jgi:hypothetical protein